jgi:hypothetical protein
VAKRSKRQQQIEIIPPRPVGRPELYSIEYCDTVIDLGKEGYSFTEMAAHIGVAKATLHRWRDAHEEFRTALTHAMSLSQAWWETQARENLKNKEFNSNLWMKVVGNRFRDEYSDTGTGVTLINNIDARKQFDVTQLSDDELEKLKQIAKKAIVK